MEPIEEIWLLISRSLSNEATAEEQQRLALLLDEDPQLRFRYEVLKQSWKVSEHITPQISNNHSGDISRILQLAETENARMQAGEIQPHPHRRSVRSLLYLGAAVAAIIFAALLLY